MHWLVHQVRAHPTTRLACPNILKLMCGDRQYLVKLCSVTSNLSPCLDLDNQTHPPES